jgi:hypothetical protein
MKLGMNLKDLTLQLLRSNKIDFSLMIKKPSKKAFFFLKLKIVVHKTQKL